MAQVTNERIDSGCSPSLTEETVGTLTSLPTLPLDLIPEIFSRLPVKLLLQLRSVCKSWKSLISDPIFAKKHLALSTTYSLHCTSYSNHKYSLKSYSRDSSVLTNIAQTQFPPNHYVYFVGSCNCILCLAVEDADLLLIRLWNPSIRKFKEFPPISEPHNFDTWMYGFGYDPISDNYKVVVVLHQCGDDTFSKTDVKVHTLGTDSWNVSVFPFVGVYVQPSGKYASGTINWLVSTDTEQSQSFIASFDLGNECYQEVLLPDDFCEVDSTLLSVFGDCLCLISGEDVWVMKKYGNKESWTKLFTISYMRDPCASSYSNISAIYVFEDDNVLLRYKGDGDDWSRKYFSHNCKNDTSKFIELESTPEICVESLISSCF